MATAAPSASEKDTAPVKQSAPKATPFQPPADTIWKRYSPHGEAPLSGAGSFALHALGLGLLILLGWYIHNKNTTGQLPVEPVRRIISGKGHGRGNGSGNGVGDGTDIEDGAGKGDGSVEKGPKEDGNLRLDPTKIAALQVQYKDDPDALRALKRGNPNFISFSQMNQDAQSKLRRGLNPGGNNGPGGDGGMKGGTSGDGDGKGPGRALSEREKRMYRWQIAFSRTAPNIYLNQLHAVGAIIGVPQGDGKTFRAIKDLRKRPAKILNEDPMESGLIFWFSATDVEGLKLTAAVMHELGVHPAPYQFMVFFPRELEEQFAQVEKEYRGASPDQIENTLFRFVPDGKGKLKPEVISQSLLR